MALAVIHRLLTWNILLSSLKEELLKAIFEFGKSVNLEIYTPISHMPLSTKWTSNLCLLDEYQCSKCFRFSLCIEDLKISTFTCIMFPFCVDFVLCTSFDKSF